MIWTIVQWVYWIVFALEMLVHLIGGSFMHWGSIKRHGKVILRAPGFFIALLMCLLWPILLPYQLAGKRPD